MLWCLSANPLMRPLCLWDFKALSRSQKCAERWKVDEAHQKATLFTNPEVMPDLKLFETRLPHASAIDSRQPHRVEDRP
jgi:hypothetical protein